MSCSKRLEVAIKCSQDFENGLILEIGPGLHEVKGFECHWISKFAGEREVLFFGGKYSLRLKGICALKTGKNYKEYFEAMHFFDSMLSGFSISEDDADEITVEHYR